MFALFLPNNMSTVYSFNKCSFKSPSLHTHGRHNEKYYGYGPCFFGTFLLMVLGGQ